MFRRIAIVLISLSWANASEVQAQGESPSYEQVDPVDPQAACDSYEPVATAAGERTRPSVTIVIDVPRDAPAELPAFGPRLVTEAEHQGWTAKLATDAGPLNAKQKGVGEKMSDCLSQLKGQRCNAQALGEPSEGSVVLIEVELGKERGDASQVVLYGTFFDHKADNWKLPVEEESCESCRDLADVEDRATSLVTKLLRKNAQSGTFEMPTVPRDATVVVDGVTTPANKQVVNIQPGWVKVVVAHPGYTTRCLDVEVVPGEAKVLPQVVLEKVSRKVEIPPPPPSPSFIQAHGPKVVVGLGGLVLVQGLWWLAVDEDSGVDGNVVNPTYNNTAPRGAWATAIGAAVGLGGAYWWWRNSKRNTAEAPPLSVAPTGDGATLMWSGSF